MEQGQCWIQTKRKYSMTSNHASPINPSYGDSWEEQAFAEDAAAGSLGGCIWPPRSYSCSFCRREFRSAQALGGHMNVHRKDRARLKQPSSPQNEILCHDLETHHPHKPVQGPFTTTSLGYLYPSPVCGLVYNKTNPNSSDPDFLASPSSPTASKALAPSVVDDNCREETLIPFYNSSILHKTSPVNSSESWPHLARDHRFYSRKFHPEVDIEKFSKGMDSRCRGKGGSDDTDVAMSLNLVVCSRAHQPVQFESTKDGDINNCKKRKTDASSNLFFPKSTSVDRHQMQPQMFEFNPSSNIEELDLELRL